MAEQRPVSKPSDDLMSLFEPVAENTAPAAPVFPPAGAAMPLDAQMASLQLDPTNPFAQNVFTQPPVLPAPVVTSGRNFIFLFFTFSSLLSLQAYSDLILDRNFLSIAFPISSLQSSAYGIYSRPVNPSAVATDFPGGFSSAPVSASNFPQENTNRKFFPFDISMCFFLCPSRFRF